MDIDDVVAAFDDEPQQNDDNANAEDDDDYVNVEQEPEDDPAPEQKDEEQSDPQPQPDVEIDVEPEHEPESQPAPVAAVEEKAAEDAPEPEEPPAEQQEVTTEQTYEETEPEQADQIVSTQYVEEPQPDPSQQQQPTPLAEEDDPPLHHTLPPEPAMMMPSTSDPTADGDLVQRTDTQISVEQHEPLIAREETLVLMDEKDDEQPVRRGTDDQHHLSVAKKPIELTESKRALLDEEDGQVIRFGNYDIRYKTPREVFSSTDITLLSVNLKEQTFDVEMDMRFFWLQPEIEEDVPWEATWSIYDDGKSLPIDPDDLFEHDTGVEWIQQEFHFHRDTKVVEWQCQFRDTFSERMELRRFPVDRQFLNIKLQGRDKRKEGNWTWIVEPPSWAPPSRFYVLRSRLGQSISDYEIFPPWADFRVIHDIDGDDNMEEEQPPFKLRMRVQRFTGYYLGNINIPMFLIVAVCLVSLVMPPDNADLANRLSVTVTSMLAGVAFRFIVSEMLPPVNYLTWMDYYVGISFLMVSLFILENALATIVNDINGNGGQVDFYFGGFLMIMWVIINLFFWYACWSNTFRVPWDVMDLEDRQPSELDDFKPSPDDQTKGANPSEPMDTKTIQMAIMRQLSTQ